MSANKLQYRKMTLEELVVLSQQNDFKALEELIRREQKNVFATFSYLAKNVRMSRISLKKPCLDWQKISIH